MPEIVNEMKGDKVKTALWLNWLNREYNQTYQRLVKTFDTTIANRDEMLHHIMQYDYKVFKSWIQIIQNNQTTLNEDWCVAWNKLMEEYTWQ